MKEKRKYSLKKIAIATAGTVIVFLAGKAVHQEYKNVEVPEGFNDAGRNYSYLNLESEEKKIVFNMIEMGNWEKGLDNAALKKVQKSKEADTACGIIVRTKAKTSIEAQADAINLLANIENIDIDFPLYLNIDEIAEKLEEKELIEVCRSYFNMFNIQTGNGYFVGISGKTESLNKLGNVFDSVAKMVVVEGKESYYNSEFQMCYFKRTKDYYTNTDYKNIIEAKRMNNNTDDTISVNVNPSEADVGIYKLKGIDVSSHQADINWAQVSKHADFAILRICTFEFLSSGKSELDKKYIQNIKGCQKNNIPYGGYVYTGAKHAYYKAIAKERTKKDAINKTIEHVKKEAELTLEYIEDTNIKSVFFDIENGSNDKFYEENPELSIIITKTYVNYLKELLNSRGLPNVEVGIYANRSMFDILNKDIEIFNNPNKWLAGYKKENIVSINDVNPEYVPDNIEKYGDLSAIQVSQTGRIPGINGAVDINYLTNPPILGINSTFVELTTKGK